MKTNRGFTLLEMLVTFTITSIIILTLHQMFDTVRVQLNKIHNSSDKYEVIRTVNEVLRNDLEQMSPVITYIGTNWSYGTLVTSNSYFQPFTNRFNDIIFL